MIHPVKTADGQDELSSRKRRLGQRHRTVLLLVDGRRSADEVRALAVQAGASESCFDELVATGLIALPQATDAQTTADSMAAAPSSPGLVADAAAASHDEPGDSSLLPPSRTLQPESVLGDLRMESVLLPEPLPAELQAFDDADPLLEEARDLLVRAVRAESPVAGSLTVLRLKRARSRSDLAGLIGEVESRIVKPHRSLAAQQTLQRVRQLLASEPASALPVAG